MTKLVLHSFLLFIMSTCLWAQVPERINGIVEAEIAFAKLSSETSTKKAFVDNMADDGVLFKPGAVSGKKFWMEAAETDDKLVWEPRYADVSAAGDIGYTTGPFQQYLNRNDKEPVASGHYVSVWTRQGYGPWKVALDIGIGHPPATFPPLTGPSILSKAVKTNSYTPDALLKVEQLFCANQSSQGLSVYNEWMGTDIKIFRPMSSPMETKESIQSFLTATDKTFSFTPIQSFISTSNDLGYVYGTGTVEISQGGNTRRLNTNYVRIWKRDDWQNWKIVLDLVAVAR